MMQQERMRVLLCNKNSVGEGSIVMVDTFMKNKKKKTHTINLEVIKMSYGWTLSDEGELYALTAGDMGFEPTGIFIDKIFAYAPEMIEFIKRQLEKYKKCQYECEFQFDDEWAEKILKDVEEL